MQRQAIPKTVFIVLALVSFLAICTCHEEEEEIPRALLISLDGFRWDYLKIVKKHDISTPTFDKLVVEGVSVDAPGVTNVFITKTMPNHYTLVTGLYEESHGIVANEFYDPLYNEYFSHDITGIKWWNGTGTRKVEPIWVTNENARHGRASGVCMFVGCNVVGQLPTYYTGYNASVPFKNNADDIIKWFTKKENPINFGALYIDEPDHTGHQYGPDSKELASKVSELDKFLGDLLDQLEHHGLLHGMNVIVTSDHGMQPVNERIFLNKFIDSSLYLSYGGSPVRHILPKQGFEDQVYKNLSTIKNAKVYKKEEIPDKFHYKNNRRIAPLVLFADSGYRLCDDEMCGELKGDHGYDNTIESMHPIFIARGPAFKKNYVADPFNSVDIYSLLCHLLDINPQPNNGSLHNIKHILAESDNLDITMLTFSLTVGFTALISGVWCIGACRGQRYSRRNRIDADWKQISLGSTSSSRAGNKPLLTAAEEDDDIV